MEGERESIREDLARLIERIDDLIYEALRDQLRGEDVRSEEKRLSRARNALRRAQGLLSTVDDGQYDEA